MDLEVVGRHALLFDDDNTAAFVNSTAALVDWNSLSIDRYDVRHLLSAPPPPRTRRHRSPPQTPDSPLQSDLDRDRYLDLPSSSPSSELDLDNGAELGNTGGYNAVPFSYGDPVESTDQKNTDAESSFRPPFSVPDSLLQNLVSLHFTFYLPNAFSSDIDIVVCLILIQCGQMIVVLGAYVILRLTCLSFRCSEQRWSSRLPFRGTLFPFDVMTRPVQPPTEKVHQIIARTAMFVSKHGGQSEIVLRVKQGDNPMFGFLMPDHHLHAYFRFLVDHQELLNGKSLEVENKADGGGGALSLLGSLYGSGEDEDGATENAQELKRDESEEAIDAANVTVSSGSEWIESSVNVAGKDEVSKHPIPSMKEKAHFIKRNGSISTVKAGTTSGMKKEGDALGSLSAAYKLQASSLSSTSKLEPSVVEPPSDLKRVIDKIVEFILKNGKQFEAVLIEQDIKHGRFPFLLPSNLYHPYYLKVLQKAEETKLPGKGFTSEKHDAMGLGVNKKTAVSKESDTLGSDIPNESDRKEKFKMVIGKSKKDGQDPPSKASQPQIGVGVDAAAAAAILQVATRGVKNPNLGFLSKTSLNGTSQGLSSEGGHASSSGSLLSSQPQNSIQKPDLNGVPSVSVPVAKAIAAVSEADYSEASLIKEQKLKTERLRRAKIFAAMVRNGAAPLKTEPLRCISVEPPESGISVSGAEVVNLAGKEREGSLVPMDVDTNEKIEKIEKSEKKDSGDNNERRSKRRYRTKSRRHEEEEEGEEDESDEGRDHKRSRKERRSHYSSHHSKDRHKHRKRHSSSMDRDSRHRHKHDSSSDDEHRHSRRQHKHDSTSDEEHLHSQDLHEQNSSSDDEYRHSLHRRRHDISSSDEHRHSQHRHKHYNPSDDKHQHRSRSLKHRKRSHSEREMELEEGEICSKSDQSKGSEGDGTSREASVDLSKSYQDRRTPSQPSDTTGISEDLRAKIRAMLMATL